MSVSKLFGCSVGKVLKHCWGDGIGPVGVVSVSGLECDSVIALCASNCSNQHSPPGSPVSLLVFVIFIRRAICFFFFVLGIFFGFCFPASLLFCFSPFCFSLLLCFCSSLLLCFSTFLLLCFFASSLLCIEHEVRTRKCCKYPWNGSFQLQNVTNSTKLLQNLWLITCSNSNILQRQSWNGSFQLQNAANTTETRQKSRSKKAPNGKK